MINRFYFLLFILISACMTTSAQVIRFSTNYPVKEESDSAIAVTELRFYLSNIQFYYKNKLVYSDEVKHHLIDLSDNDPILLAYNIPANYDSLTFLLGVDSLTSVSGVFGNDLDPMHGMYWTWHSGYIHLKIEGYDPKCNSRQNRFQYHIGGIASALPMGFRVNRNEPIHFQVDLKKWMNQQTFFLPELMTPGEQANLFALDFSRYFELNP